MALIFEQIHTEGIAQLSYLIGDDDAGVAAVVDPRPDVACYLKLARARQVAITHIFETHIHADLVSGARELQAQAEAAQIYVSAEGSVRYGFEHEPIQDGDTFTLGKAHVTVCHTPGHTPEHVAFLLAETNRTDDPWGVLTGDSLFVNSAGRPDLLGTEQEGELIQQLYTTLRDVYLQLDDSVIIYPGHGQGSPCGAGLGDRLNSTIGYERRANPFLQFQDVERFADYVIKTAPPAPTYYPRMKEVNAQGPAVHGNLRPVPGLPPYAFQAAIEDRDNVLLDTRAMLAFDGGHIPGALNIGGQPILSVWAGWLLDPDRPLLLVLESDAQLHDVVRYLVRTGYTNFAGYLVGGMTAWNNAGLPLASVGQMTVHEVKAAGRELQLLDVRAPDEREAGYIPHARHIFLGELRENLDQLDKSRPITVYCDSGYRASIASSILRQAEFDPVYNVPGSWQAWTSAGFPVETEQPEKEIAS